jgi:asparagine synthase (glutamine-hydrolysing)
MCGFAGILELGRRTGPEGLRFTISKMAATLRHRGPDDQGVWVDANAGVALGHRRLSILDRSRAGHQPMVSESGRYVIAFNGEIYNYQELRRELEQASGGAPRFRGHSDTEVLLAVFERRGVRAAVPRLNGMFTFAVWDRQERALYLSRDRLGEKPLYYGWMGKTLLFGSELKALRAHPGFCGEINRDALAIYLRHNCIPAPYSIYRGVRKLPPATVLTVTSGCAQDAAPAAYWSLKDVAVRGVADPLPGTDEDLIAQLDALLRDAVRIRMLSDVPLGAFLSGGIDSSTVVAMMQAQSPRPVRTFSIGFSEHGYNEATHAKAVAQHLGTAHTEFYVSPAEALAVIPRLPEIYDEPFADSSQIPTFLVSQLARRQVTVSLSGDGGDEVFGGYHRYLWNSRICKLVGWMPKSLRRAGAAAITLVSPQRWDAIFRGLDPLLPAAMKYPAPGQKLHKLAGIITLPDTEAMFIGVVSHWSRPESVVQGAREAQTLLTTADSWCGLPHLTAQMMFLDSVTYLPDDILTKLDRASMAVSLEARVPFLDHRILELAWRIPLSLKIREKKGKWILRQVLHRYVPPELVERPKSGFGIPLDAWLRGPLRDWAESLLDERRLRQEGFFHPEPIREKWIEHLTGKRDWQFHLWDVLMFEAWLEENRQAAVDIKQPSVESLEATDIGVVR